jgi:hypothetical protein
MREVVDAALNLPRADPKYFVEVDGGDKRSTLRDTFGEAIADAKWFLRQNPTETVTIFQIIPLIAGMSAEHI